MWCRRSALFGAAVAAVCALGAAGAADATAVAGWSTVDIAVTGTYARRYVPPGLDLSKAQPVVVLLHGSGARPESYEALVEDAADAAGCVLLLPRSQLVEGWGDPLDPVTISAGLEALRTELVVDEARVGLAGHSSGGAYAFLLAFTTVDHWSGVFSLAAPFVAVDAIANGRFTAPVRMYYGSDDPNFTGGSRDALMTQWQALGVSVEEDLQLGYGHTTWPASSMAAGLAFVTGQAYPLQPGEGSGPCRGTETRMCLRDGRFQVELTWVDSTGRTGVGRAAEAGASDSGLFWFFDASNWEVLVKVLDGCSVNGKYWVFAAAATDVGYELEVLDLVGGGRFVHMSEAGEAAVALNGTFAIDGCLSSE